MLRGLVLLVLLLASARIALRIAESRPDVVEQFRSSGLAPFRDEAFHAADAHDDDVAFEGQHTARRWYYKLVGPYSDDVIVVIAGLFQNRVNTSSSEAFIHVAHNTQVNYYRFPPSAFKATKQAAGFTVTIGDCVFTEKGLALSIMPDADDDANDNAIMAEVSFEDTTPWPVRILHPSTMGAVGWLGGQECSHHVVSLHHKLHGYISVGELLTDLEMGTGYLEKDWGSSFPSTWIWAQSNHFAVLKPPKRGTGPGGEGEVWAEAEENVEEVRDEGPGNGESSGAISALYADHVNNHVQPVSLFLSVARVPLPVPAWLLSSLGFTSENDRSLPGFVASFLHDGQTHVFASYQLDALAKFELEVRERDDDKEVLHLTFVDASRTRQLVVQLHKPVQINAGKRRKKDTECLKKAISQKNRERERLGKLNPLQEAFLMDGVGEASQPSPATEEEEQSPEVKAAIAAGIAAEKANTPEAKLAELYEKPVPVPAPIVASFYGPKDGRMQKFVKESLIGGRIEVQFSELLSAADYGRMMAKERRAKEWRQTVVGTEVLYAHQLYRGIGKPAAMETVGDVQWLLDETDRRNLDWHKSWPEWLAVPKNGLTSALVLLLLLATAALLSACCCCRAKKTPAAKLKAQ